MLAQMYIENPHAFPAGEFRDFQNNYSYSMNLFAIDCKKYQFGLITGRSYKHDGTPLGSPSSRTTLHEITPDTLIDEAASSLCRKKR
jgi:hypothetical protein